MAQEDRVQELADAIDGKSEPSAEPESTDQPEATPDIEAGKAQEQEAPQDEQFYELDLSAVPDDADREWLAKRHHDMQSAFTKKTQSLAEQRREAEKITEAFNDPDTLAALLRARGYDLEDDDDEDDFLDDDQAPDFRQTPEWQEFQQFRSQLTEAQQAAVEEQSFRQSVDELQTREGREVDDDEWELLWSLNQAGVPVDNGWERISNLRKAERKQLVSAKQGAPQVSKVGKSATQVPDLSDERARVDFLAEAIEANRKD